MVPSGSDSTSLCGIRGPQTTKVVSTPKTWAEPDHRIGCLHNEPAAYCIGNETKSIGRAHLLHAGADMIVDSVF